MVGGWLGVCKKLKKKHTTQQDHPVAAQLNFYLFFTTALMGHCLTHFPHSIHFSLSIIGRPKPFWEMAPTGQKWMIGQRWFCGQASGLIESAIFL
jgi:hypothetical protein